MRPQQIDFLADRGQGARFLEVFGNLRHHLRVGKHMDVAVLDRQPAQGLGRRPGLIGLRERDHEMVDRLVDTEAGGAVVVRMCHGKTLAVQEPSARSPAAGNRGARSVSIGHGTCRCPWIH